MSLSADDIETRLRPGQRLLGKYRVIRVLGKGAMGVVVAARDVDASQTVAIKFMLPRARDFGHALERFVREAQAASKLTSENVARVIDAGEWTEGTPYIVMEYLEGMDLAELLKARGPFAVADAVDVILQVCACMAEAHELGVIHRDLKPGNLFVAQRPDGTPLVKVLDFGLSKLLETPEQDLSLTETSETMGSPAYMSPEQSRSAKSVDARADIWSLGVTLFELLSDHMPFNAGSRVELFARILTEEPSPLREFSPWVPKPLADIVARTLRKEPEDRFQTVGELASALSAFASDWGRAFCRSPQVPVPWTVVARADGVDRDGDTTQMVPGPQRLNLAEFLGDLPTRVYALRSVPADDTSTFSDSVAATIAERRETPRRRGLIALAVMLILGAGVGLWWVASKPDPAAERTNSEAARAPAVNAAGTPAARGAEPDGDRALAGDRQPDTTNHAAVDRASDVGRAGTPVVEAAADGRPAGERVPTRGARTAVDKPARKSKPRKKKKNTDRRTSPTPTGLFDTMQ